MNTPPRRVPVWPGSPAALRPRRHVLSRQHADCAIATAATVTGVPYEEAASAAFSLREEGLGGLRPEPFLKLLARLDGRPWRADIPSLRGECVLTLATFAFPEELVAANISHWFWPWRCHAIAATATVVYDPNYDEPLSQSAHPWRNWKVRVLFRRKY
jgi:hypothetical protein